MGESDVKYLLALRKMASIGDVLGRRLLQHYGSAKAVFEEVQLRPKEAEQLWPKKTVRALHHQIPWNEINLELDFMEQEGITPLAISDVTYPRRLKFCHDAPMMLFAKGGMDLNHPKTLAVVGTRRATAYGRKMVREILTGLQDEQVQIISGLAYGIDIIAHQVGLELNLPTIGILAHGLHTVYPEAHRSIVDRMMVTGGVVSEHGNGIAPYAENFPKRNRIVAGMADAILVIESQKKGGSMITADLGFGYSRDIFAVPGRATDVQSAGCNFLIRTNKAMLIETAGQLKHAMNWRSATHPASVQKQLFVPMNPMEERLYNHLQKVGECTVDQLALMCQVPVSAISIALLQMEMNGLVRALPGKRIELA